jgi:hypothetical protein
MGKRRLLMGCYSFFADDPRVLAIWQHTAILPLTENNGPLVESRRHFSWLINVRESDTNYIFRAPKFTEGALSKVNESLCVTLTLPHPHSLCLTVGYILHGAAHLTSPLWHRV